MSTIHPTAIVSPEADIAPGCRIGPYCHVGPQVRLGEDCELRSHVVLEGPAVFGRGNIIHPFCSLGGRSQDLKYQHEPTYLEVGDGNTFRECCTVNRGTAPGAVTRIGSHNHFLAYAHVAHDCVIGHHVIFSNNGTVAGHVEVGDHAILGGLSGVHQFCRIGAHAIVGGCTKIVQDVPPFMIADGNPAEVRGINQVGMERRGFSAETIRSLREAYRFLYRGKDNVKQALAKIREALHGAEIDVLVAFIETSQRGIIR